MSNDTRVVPNRQEIINLCAGVILNAVNGDYNPQEAEGKLQRALWLAREDAGDYWAGPEVPVSEVLFPEVNGD